MSRRVCLSRSRACSDSGYAVPGGSRCCVHGRKAWATKPPANRYAYGGDWPERRVRVLKRDGYVCQLRYADICLGKASQVDHIVQPEAGGTNALENLRAVCRRCHARRTARQGALAKQRRAAQRKNPR
jgi:5-methylcytosine-specific restriction enzyme A